MPILDRELDIFPHDLLETADRLGATLNQREEANGEGPRWYAMYTRSRHEKQLMRRLQEIDVPFYGPIIERRHRSPSGRVRRCYEPLFANYVFVLGAAEQRYAALTTNCISRCCPVVDGQRLTADLAMIQRLINTGEPLAPETRISEGARVAIRSGPFAGFEGLVVRRHGETRLLVYVEFMQQGASVLLDDCQLDLL